MFKHLSMFMLFTMHWSLHLKERAQYRFLFLFCKNMKVKVVLWYIAILFLILQYIVIRFFSRNTQHYYKTLLELILDKAAGAEWVNNTHIFDSRGSQSSPLEGFRGKSGHLTATTSLFLDKTEQQLIGLYIYLNLNQRFH